jgi:dienelactone hydrolase
MFLVPRQSAGQAAFPATLEAPQQIVLPTGRPSGFPVNDRVPVAWYAPQRTEERAPAVILLHPLGEWRNTLMHRFARFLQARGFGAAVVTLPYHMKRWPKGHPPLDQFVAANVDRAADAFAQSEADARVVADWLVRRSDVDPARVGVIGVSLGAIVLHAAMGQDSRLSAGVAILGGGDLPYLYQRSLLFRILHPSTTRKLSEAERARLAEADPLTYADENRPRRVLMIQAARDVLIPPSASTQLWEALGRPPIRWLDTNHYGPMLGERTIMAAAAAFLQEAWSGRAGNPRLPPIYAPTIKIGALFGLDSTAEPALQWQALSFVGRPDHMSLLHLDFGWSGRGFFAGLAATVNPYLDVGVGRRLGGRVSRPYLSLHIVL